MVDNGTSLKKFIMDNKDRDDLVGDICSDLLRDKEFTKLRNDYTRKNYIISVGLQHYAVQDAITLLFQEYSGEEVFLDEE